MVNHLRTLLLNRAPVTRTYPSYYLEEYEPADFRPVTLPHGYQAARRILFGSDRERSLENYRARQYLAVLFGCELREFVTSWDQRLTCGVDDTDFPQPSVSWQTYKTDYPLTAWNLLGDYALADDERLERTWRVEFLDGTQVALSTPSTQQTTTASYAWESGTVGQRVSAPVALPGSTLSFSAQEGPAFPDNLGPAAQVTVVSRPRAELPTILEQLTALSEETLADIFATHQSRGTTEPLPTFRNCFYEHPNPLLRLGGFLLAYATGIEEYRRGSS